MRQGLMDNALSDTDDFKLLDEHFDQYSTKQKYTTALIIYAVFQITFLFVVPLMADFVQHFFPVSPTYTYHFTFQLFAGLYGQGLIWMIMYMIYPRYHTARGVIAVVFVLHWWLSPFILFSKVAFDVYLTHWIIHLAISYPMCRENKKEFRRKVGDKVYFQHYR